MTPIITFYILQAIIIVIGTIVCYTFTRNGNETEKRYIFPYCLSSAIIMCLLIHALLVDAPYRYIYVLMYLAGCSEILLIPNYISTIIGKKKQIVLQVSICVTIYMASNYFVQNPITLLYLFSNLYITLYSGQYFIWLFKNNEKLNLKNTPHYWIIMGICICFTGSIPYYLSEFLIIRFESIEVFYQISSTFHSTFIILNVTMYIFFIKAFLCKKKFQKSFSGQF
jgi:hypothetical protein